MKTTIDLGGQPDSIAVSPDGKYAAVVIENERDVVSILYDKVKKGVYIQRYKGLGEMNPDQLWETTMNPENRTLLKVEINDFYESEIIFDTLMGSDSMKRRTFIEENALNVKNLDI